MMNKILVQVPVSQIRSCNGHVTLIAHSTRDKMSTIILQIVAVKREFEAGLRHAAIGKLCQPSSYGYLFRIREG